MLYTCCPHVWSWSLLVLSWLWVKENHNITPLLKSKLLASFMTVLWVDLYHSFFGVFFQVVAVPFIMIPHIFFLYFPYFSPAEVLYLSEMPTDCLVKYCFPDFFCGFVNRVLWVIEDPKKISAVGLGVHDIWLMRSMGFLAVHPWVVDFKWSCHMSDSQVKKKRWTRKSVCFTRI